MNSNKNNNTKIETTTNLIGETHYRNYLQLQAYCGFAQRGGVQFPYSIDAHSKRLVNDVNVLTSKENKHLVFSESIYSN